MRAERLWRGRNQRDQGFALLAVLSLLLVSAGLMATLTSRSVNSHLQSSVYFDNFQRSQLMQGVARLLVHAHGRDPDASDISCTFGTAQITASMTHHSGLIDLNAAGMELLAIGFRALKRERAEALELARTVLAYRSVKQPSSNSDRQDKVAFGLKHRLFESVAELTDFAGMEKQALPSLFSVFTVHSGSGTLDLRSASPVLERAVREADANTQPFIISGSALRGAITVEVVIHRGANHSAPKKQPYNPALYAILVPSTARTGTHRFVFVLQGFVAANSERLEGNCPETIARFLGEPKGEGI